MTFGADQLRPGRWDVPPVQSQAPARISACEAPARGTVSFPDNDVTFLADD
jgi:hypothetical protein